MKGSEEVMIFWLTLFLSIVPFIVSQQFEVNVIPSNVQDILGNAVWTSNTGSMIILANTEDGILYTSLNFGVTFTAITDTPPVSFIAGADDGSIICVLAGNSTVAGIYCSTNFGLPPYLPGYVITSIGVEWASISSSKTGQYMIACANSAAAGCFMTNNGPASWIPVISLPYFDPVATSYSGNTNLVVVTARNGSSSLYFSSNLGNSWTGVSNTTLPLIQISIGCMLDGSTCVSTSDTGGLYISTNSAGSWTELTGSNIPPEPCLSITSTIYAQMICTTVNGVYYSDGGVNWVVVKNIDGSINNMLFGYNASSLSGNALKLYAISQNNSESVSSSVFKTLYVSNFDFTNTLSPSFVPSSSPSPSAEPSTRSPTATASPTALPTLAPTVPTNTSPSSSAQTVSQLGIILLSTLSIIIVIVGIVCCWCCSVPVFCVCWKRRSKSEEKDDDHKSGNSMELTSNPLQS